SRRWAEPDATRTAAHPAWRNISSGHAQTKPLRHERLLRRHERSWRRCGSPRRRRTRAAAGYRRKRQETDSFVIAGRDCMARLRVGDFRHCPETDKKIEMQLRRFA